ncbi:hypothetical protein C8A01DRAFT_33527 [Parachaetomium inaequale]|uniref:F-box domain-containing protein n=1 Tax=Parachaetomium inaequale TaxID=2588326 RepID=A0AAN6STE0_9PEZI|nr:hypothetical protein C8A01DRAFT_33527 [Parachaetomium inaequale]
MATLARLPNEILALILGRFCLHCCEARETRETPDVFVPPSGHDEQGEPTWDWDGHQVLYSACLVSARLRDIAQPILYHEFIPGYGHPCRRLIPFVRTVALRRDLAAAVRRVQVHYDSRAIPPGGLGAVFEEAARARAIELPAFLAPFRHRWARAWPKYAYTPAGDELITMLLACLPNLARLIVAAASLFGDIPASALQAAGVERLPLQTCDASGYFAPSRVADILNMARRTLTTLNLDGCDAVTVCTLARAVIPGLPRLRNLCITKTPLTGSNLALLLSCCAGLESFILEARKSSCPLGSAQPSAILPPGAVEHLLGHRETLKTLRLDCHVPYSAGRMPSEDEVLVFRTDLMPQLRRFPVLQDLFLNLAIVYGGEDEDEEGSSSSTSSSSIPLDQCLPQSIVSLSLADNVTAPRRLARLAEDLSRLQLAAASGEFPHLRKIRLDAEEFVDDDNLAALFAGAGVDFAYAAMPLSNGLSRGQLRLPPRSWGFASS